MSDKNIKIFKLLIILFKKLKKRRQKQIYFLLILIVLSAFSELVSLLSVFPFLEIVSNSESINEIKLLKILFNIFGFSQNTNIILVVTFIFSLTAIVAALIKTLNLWYGNRLSASIGSDLSYECFRRNLYQDYLQFIGNNSSNIIANNTYYIDTVTDALAIAARFFSSIIIAVFIAAFLLYFNFFSSLFAILIFSFTYFLIAKYTKNKLTKNSKVITKNSNAQIQLMKESNGSYRDLLLGSNQKKYINIYKNLDFKRRVSISQNNFIFLFPRNTIESLLLVFLAVLTFFVSIKTSSTSQIIPTVGTLAVGAQKLLPYMQQIYGGWSSLIGSSASISQVLKMLEIKIQTVEERNNTEVINFKKSLNTKNLSLKYGNKKEFVFQNLNLNINKGDLVGIVGESGSGKSSLADVLMGLVKPTNGSVIVDGINIYSKKYPFRYINWRNSITHVPQSIFLIDSTILNNIAFNAKDDVDLDRVKEAAKKANIDKYIENLPLGYSSYVGEDGIMLSGGQKQRIAIARALYSKSEILVFDEPTSSLDSSTEKEILNTIFDLRGYKTIFIISHQVETLKSCDKLIKLTSS